MQPELEHQDNNKSISEPQRGKRTALQREESELVSESQDRVKSDSSQFDCDKNDAYRCLTREHLSENSLMDHAFIAMSTKDD